MGATKATDEDSLLVMPLGAAPQVDSKKELVKVLKATCEAFIMGATKATVEDMLSFITKVTAVKVASAASAAKPLREQVGVQACSLNVSSSCAAAVATHGQAAS